jgi:hypothetical protein
MDRDDSVAMRHWALCSEQDVTGGLAGCSMAFAMRGWFAWSDPMH